MLICSLFLKIIPFLVILPYFPPFLRKNYILQFLIKGCFNFDTTPICVCKFWLAKMMSVIGFLCSHWLLSVHKCDECRLCSRPAVAAAANENTCYTHHRYHGLNRVDDFSEYNRDNQWPCRYLSGNNLFSFGGLKH